MSFKFILLVLGTVMIIEGLPYFLFPRQVKGFFRKIEHMDSALLRKFGFVSMLTGLGLVYLAQKILFR